ncbi:cupin domain-containing protein [Sutcliffiella deserti]|uniref:cupin domain-containing protein n=1 Tax=Sutcliffiella deserti TaxID=2875501 RepID=UPI001CBD5B48|nr:cupin domain-containing protein [Sutcliffiella deserti]
MYYDPSLYSYRNYTNSNTPVYYSDHVQRGQENHPELIEAILGGVKREASAIELYRQLAHVAPNEKHKKDILQALEGKNVLFTQFSNLYRGLTGTKPVFQLDKVPFHSYSDGLSKAYQGEIEGYQEYQKVFLLTQLPQVRNLFLWALTGEQENAARFSYLNQEISTHLTDYGPEPFVVNIEELTKQNNFFRTALWTGSHFQLTLMSINVGEDIGLEIHPTLDQFLRVEQGQGVVQMGDSKDRLDFQENVYDNYAIIIPAGKWHNLTNTGNEPLKLYSIYAPPQHPYGTVHETKAIAMAAEEEHH